MLRLRRLVALAFTIGLGFFPACDEPEVGANRVYRFFAGCRYIQGECFADLQFAAKVDFDDPDHVPTDTQFRISFGDGSVATTPVPLIDIGTSGAYNSFSSGFITHNYKIGGTYHVELQGLDGSLINDTTVTLRKALKKMSSKPSVFGNPRKFIWQGSSGEYYLIHTIGQNNQFPVSQWGVTKLTESLDSVSTGQGVDDGTGPDVTNYAVTSSGNIAQVSASYVEMFDNTGRLLFSKRLNTTNRPLSLRIVNDQMLLVSDSTNHLFITKFDLLGNVVSKVKIKMPSDLTATGTPRFTSTGDLAMYYKTSGSSLTDLYIYDGNGNVKTKASLIYFLKIVYPVENGLVITTNSGQSGGLLRTDLQGNILWARDWNYASNTNIEVFGSGTDTWVFSEDMDGVRINASGLSPWNKKLGAFFDEFVTATVNAKGNFVLVGNRSCDFAKDTSKPCAANALQFVLVEVDKDGGIIDH